MLLGLLAGCWEAGAAETNTIKPVLSATITERYDSNVMLQNEGAQAGIESFVTSVLPLVGAKATGTGDVPYALGLQYAPDFTFFHSLSRESYLRHIGVFDFEVQHKDFSANARVNAQYTDGTTAPPNWGTTANGDQVPAMGVIEVRNRRRNMYFTSGVTGRQQWGKSFVRGVFDARIWDFMTDDTFETGMVIQNYYDRSDINGGVDLGLKVHPAVEPYLGYRYGHQAQEYRANTPSYSYANDYHRFTLGLSSKPVKWLTLNGQIGPSIHVLDVAKIAPGTHTQQDYLFFLGSATFQIDTQTTFKVVGGQYLLPAAAGNGVYQNLSACGTLDHRLSAKWRGSCAFGFTDYDFNATFARWDQRFVPEVRVEYAFSQHFSASAWYAYEWAVNTLDIPNGSKRDYDRHVVGLGLKASY